MNFRRNYCPGLNLPLQVSLLLSKVHISLSPFLLFSVFFLTVISIFTRSLKNGTIMNWYLKKKEIIFLNLTFNIPFLWQNIFNESFLEILIFKQKTKKCQCTCKQNTMTAGRGLSCPTISPQTEVPFMRVFMGGCPFPTNCSC